MSAVPVPPPLLLVATPAGWIDAACGSRELLLQDHANCEKKAASTALALMFAYAEDLHLAGRMSRLAREELRHYEQVAHVMAACAVTPRRLAPGRYAERLRRLVARSEPQRELDLMICGAFIEARSCERFAALAPVIGAPLDGLFGALHAAEQRHQRIYVDLARRCAQRHGLPLEARLADFARLEAELIVSADPLFRFHSGVPVRGSDSSS